MTATCQVACPSWCVEVGCSGLEHAGDIATVTATGGDRAAREEAMRVVVMPAWLPADDPAPSVLVEIAGRGSKTAYLTPEEARSLAAALTVAADHEEGLR